MIAVLHWRQLGGLLNVSNTVSTRVEPEAPKTMVIKFTRVVRQTERALLLEKVDAEGIAWERWIPKSMVVNNLGGGELEIKRPA
jgi:hypothetical protein